MFISCAIPGFNHSNKLKNLSLAFGQDKSALVCITRTRTNIGLNTQGQY